MIMQWMNDRAQEKSSKIGALLAAVAAAATTAGALESPWCYLAFVASVILIAVPDK